MQKNAPRLKGREASRFRGATFLRRRDRRPLRPITGESVRSYSPRRISTVNSGVDFGGLQLSSLSIRRLSVSQAPLTLLPHSISLSTQLYHIEGKLSTQTSTALGSPLGVEIKRISPFLFSRRGGWLPSRRGGWLLRRLGDEPLQVIHYT